MTTALADMEVTDADLAALAGCTPRRIRQLAEAGKLARTGRNRFKLADSVRLLIEEAAENNEGSELQKEKLRKLRAEASMAELELAKSRDLVAPIAQMEKAWERACATIRANMLQVPQRVVTTIIGETDEARMKAALTAEIKQALNSAAEAEIDLDDEEDEAHRE